MLILGSGLVSKPGVVYLSEHGFNVILGSRTLEKAEAVVKGLKNTSAKQIDVETEEGMWIVVRNCVEFDVYYFFQNRNE